MLGVARRRLKLPWMRLSDLETGVLGSAAPSDTLFAVLLLADWNPVCQKVEAGLEAGHGRLAAEAAANGGCEAARVRVVKLDASEGNTLQVGLAGRQGG
jgi:hypothetical protein